MDFGNTIISLLGLQDVTIDDLKIFKKQRKVEIKVRQNRDSCFCPRCGLQFDSVKDWDLKILRAPPLGIYQHVTVKFMQLRGYGVRSENWIGITPRFETFDGVSDKSKRRFCYERKKEEPVLCA